MFMRWITGLFWFLAVCFAAGSAWHILPHRSLQSAAPEDGFAHPSVVPGRVQPSPETIDRIILRDIFVENGRPSDNNAGEDAPQTTGSGEIANEYQLVGIIVGRERQAIWEQRELHTVVVTRSGDLLGATRIVDIRPGEVEVVSGAGSAVIRLRDE